jgi:putative ABC transport system substrate-binding protein
MRRRNAIALAGALSLARPFAAGAQPRAGAAPAAILVVGGTEANLAPQGLRRGLAGLGYVEGRDVSIAFIPGELPELLPELERRRIDVLFAIASKGVLAAHRATRTVPIVAIDLESEPVAEGFIRSFARPGGNLTGFFLDQPGLAGKWLQLITEMVPGAARLAVLRDLNLGAGPWWAVEAAARSLRLEIRGFEMNVAALERVFGDIAAYGPAALVLLSSPLVPLNRTALAALALKARLPSVTLFRVYAEDGGLMAYGPDPHVMGQQAAGYVDRILKGTKPADLPVQQPTRFELVINLKTAKALGLTIPPTVLARADEVIE